MGEQRTKRFGVAVLWVLALGCGVGAPAGALNIVLNFEDTLSASPSFDPFTGSNAPSGLEAMFEFAEQFYQDVFETSHTLTINYWYTNLADNTLGRHTPVSQSGGRVNESNIRIDTTTSGGATRNWFIDPTPDNNSEFNMSQTLWRDLTGTQQTDWYNWSGTPLDTFEVGFTGNAVGGGAASGATDMLSVVLHEVGHALGMSSGNNSTVAETADGDYDYDSVNIFGRTLAVETANDSGDDNLNIAHVENTNALMTPSIPTSRRRLPSHTDLLAMAAVHNYTALDIPRREYYGGSNWNTTGNWVGDTVPGAADDVFVRDAQGSGVTLTAGLTANGFARDIEVSEGANIDTNAFKLDAAGDVTVTGLDSDIFINPGGELEADEVFIQDQAEIEMNGGLVDVRRLTIDDGTQLEGVSGGAMTIDVSERLVNNGVIDVDADAVMTFVSTAGSPWDLDGGGDGELFANGGDLIFDSGAMSDGFDGEITVGAGHFFRFDAAWSNTTGVLDLNGGATTADRAAITGGTITANGAGRIEAAGQAHFDPNVNLNSTTAVDLSVDTNLEFNGATTVSGTDFTLRNSSDLEFDGAATVTGDIDVNVINNITGTGPADIDFDGFTLYSNATITKTGSGLVDLVIQQTGDARYVGTTTVNADVYDLDGFSGANTLEFGDGVNSGSLVLNVDGVDTTGNTFNGTLDLDNAGFSNLLTVNLSNPSDRWTMAGTADLSGNAFFFLNRIAGSGVNFSGTVNVSNSLVSINADATLTGTSQVNFNSASSNLGFRGVTQIDSGASFSGAGTVTAIFGSDLTLSNGANLGAASLTNSGTMSIAGTGAATVDDFTQTTNGRWEVDLAGSVSTQYDVLVSDSVISLDGVLSLSITGGYNPALYDVHTVLNGVFFASLSGKFATIDGVVLDATTGLAVTYTSQDVLVQRALLGDADLDGFIGQADLDAVLLNWGTTTGMWTTGDFDGDGFVAQSDLDAILLNWGTTAEPSFNGAPVPEPGVFFGWLAAGLLGGGRRRRRA